MSLAPTFAGGGMRPGSFLPAIKCSSCGEEIEIAAMGEHICHQAAPAVTPAPAPARSYIPMPAMPTPAPAPAPMPMPQSPVSNNMSNPFTLRQINAGGYNSPHAPSPLQQSSIPTPQTRSRAKTLTSNHDSTPRAPRMPLPKINPDMANRPFLGPPQNAPLSPAISVRSASSNGSKPGMQRSMTSPAARMFDFRPPSPELSANLDCAFPMFPTPASSNNSRPSTSSGRKTPTGSERAPSRGGSRLDRVHTNEQALANLEPRSPRTTGGETVMQRSNTLKHGPFNTVKKRQGSQGSTGGFSMSRASREESTTEPPRPSTSSSNYSFARRPSVPTTNQNLPESTPSWKRPPQRPARPEEELSPSFLGQFSDEPGSMTGTDPRTESESSHQLSKMRSESSLRSGPRRPSLKNSPASEPSNNTNAYTLPPRRDSRAGRRVDYRLEDAPPVPRAVQQHRQASVHAPSESGSSSRASTENSISNNSSTGPSPIGSAASSIETYSPLNFETSRYGDEPDMRVAGLNWKPQQKAPRPVEQPRQPSPVRRYDEPPQPRESHYDTEQPSPLESPMDPALTNPSQQTYQPYQPYKPWQPNAASQPRPAAMPERPQTAPRLTPEPRPPPSQVLAPPRLDSNEYDPFRPPSPLPPPQAEPTLPRLTLLGASGSASAPPPASSRFQPPPIPADVPPARNLSRRPTVSKAPCRGCGMTIEGKSVKAADGRLTGRWHKSCFVCRTCHQPFLTADFYVIDNEPYCEQHYHEHNGSLCNGCNRGIEGQYLETTTSARGGVVDKKFHPRCFTCCECREVLSDDYFELAGRVYCERHALATMRAQARQAHGPGGLYPPSHRGLMAERRTTRLMNMV